MAHCLRGRTCSFCGPAFFRKCENCKKMVLANKMVAFADFPGDHAYVGDTFPVVCSPCAKILKEEKVVTV